MTRGEPARTSECSDSPIVAPCLSPHTIVMKQESPRVEVARIDGQMVVWAATDRTLHLLDPITSLVFELADGTTTLGQTASEICVETGRPHDEVERFIGVAASRLVELGLLTDR